MRTCFGYSDEGLVGEYDATGAEIKEYGWKPGGTWSTDPLFMRNSSGEYFWYHNDHLGTPQMMTTSSGAVVWKAKYSSFGKATVDPSSNVINPLRFAGQYFDSETGLHYNWNRYYDPNIGRYIRTDPIGLEGGLNLYSYVYNNPTNGLDPDGQFGFLIPILAGACSGGGCEALGGLIVAGAIWWGSNNNGNGPGDSATGAGSTGAGAGSSSSSTSADSAGESSSAGTGGGGDNCDDCFEILNKIQETMMKLNKRYLHQCRDKRGLWESHVDPFNQMKIRLSRLVAQAEAKGCQVPPKAYVWLNTECPLPGTPYSTSPGYK